MIDENFRELGTGALMKYMRVDTLRALLADLPDDALVMPNAVANLSVYEGVVESGHMLGYIDFAGETWSQVE